MKKEKKQSFGSPLIDNSKSLDEEEPQRSCTWLPPHGMRDVETDAQREKSTREIIKDHTPTRKGVPDMIY